MNEGKSGPVIPLWKLERYLIGELPPAEMARIDKLKAEDPEVAEWIKALQAEHADLKASHPTGRMADGIRDRLNGPAPRHGQASQGRRAPQDARPDLWDRIGDRMGRGWRNALIAPAFALVLLLALVPNPITKHINSDMATPAQEGREGTQVADGAGGAGGNPETTRLKGSLPALFLYRKADTGAEALRPGSAVRAGDLIQVQYEAAGRKFGAVFSVDGGGTVTWHLPESGNRSAALSPRGRIALKSAFELDEAPGREDFHFIASDSPFPLDSAAGAVVKGNSSAAENGGAGFPAHPLPDSQGNRSKAAMTHTFFALTKDNLK